MFDITPTNQPAGLSDNDLAVTKAHQHDLRYCTLQLQIPMPW